MSGDEQEIAPALFEAVDLPMKGSLTAMMLDTKRTFDELVIKYSSSPERAKRLLDNKLYKYVSTSLAGTQEYMAMEKLVAVQRDPRFDLVILDTPPTANALDFLDAPGRLVEAVDSPTMRWFVQAFESTGKVGFNLLARSAAVVLRGLGRITGRRLSRRDGRVHHRAERSLRRLQGARADGRELAAQPRGLVRARHEPGAR